MLNFLNSNTKLIALTHLHLLDEIEAGICSIICPAVAVVIVLVSPHHREEAAILIRLLIGGGAPVGVGDLGAVTPSGWIIGRNPYLDAMVNQSKTILRITSVLDLPIITFGLFLLDSSLCTRQSRNSCSAALLIWAR